MEKNSISKQLVSAGTDGQYFHLGFPEKIREILNLKKCFFYWDPAHRLMLAENHVRSAKIGTTQKDQFPFFTNMVAVVKDILSDTKYEKKYEHLIEISENTQTSNFRN